VEPGTVWTWNAIGKAAGAWNLTPHANESRKGFLLNHLISEELPAPAARISNSDPVTGQAGWYDVRVRIYKAAGRARRCDLAAVRPMKPFPAMDLRAARLARLLRAAKGGQEMTQLALVIDLNVCVGCHACVTSCKEWNTSGDAGPLVDLRPYGADPTGTFFNRVQTFEVGEFPEHRDGALPEVLPALRGAALRAGVPHRGLLQAPRGRHRAGGLRQVHRLQVLLLGLPLRRARGRRGAQGDDQVHPVRGPHLRPLAAEVDRKPACVKACPTSARLYGDIHDPDSEVSQAIRERGGYQLMPEWGTKPANHYLPRRKTRITIREEELERSDNPLKIDAKLPRPSRDEPSLDDVTSW
jgi:sulfite dehydrogenase (quinone) subunit SoeB